MHSSVSNASGPASPKAGDARLSSSSLSPLPLPTSSASSAPSPLSSPLPSPLPRIAVLATGGTIAGLAPDAASTAGYQAGALGIGALLDAVPGLAALARIEAAQIASIDSKDMSPALWTRLARRTNALLARADIDGIVITHGTDTLEETAWLLHLTVKSAKPVVLTAAMRPASALSADGPLNLLNAVTVAASAHARGQGVLVVLNNRIHCARDVAKVSTSAVDAFQSPEVGALGWVQDGRVEFQRRATRAHTVASIFAGLVAGAGALSGVARGASLHETLDDASRGLAHEPLYRLSVDEFAHGSLRELAREPLHGSQNGSAAEPMHDEPLHESTSGSTCESTSESACESTSGSTDESPCEPAHEPPFAWPQVEIVASYAGVSRIALDALVAAGVRGIVVAGTGNGSIYASLQQGLAEAAARGVSVVRASRVGAGHVMHNGAAPDDALGFVSAGTLNPYKARVLLMLALAAGIADAGALQRVFDTY